MSKMIITLASVLALAATGGFTNAQEKTEEEAAQEFLGDLSGPELQLRQDRESYVDPSFPRKWCPDHPYKPGWAAVFPKEERWKADLAHGLFMMHYAASIKEAGECTCDLRYPDWEVIRADLEAIATTVEDRFEGKKLGRDYDARGFKQRGEIRELCRAARRSGSD